MRNVLWRAPRATMRTVAAVAAAAVALPLSMATGAAAFAATPGAAQSATPSVVVPQEAAAAPFDALIFSKTAGFRHDAIPAGIAAIEKLGTENGFTVDVTEDAAAFNDENLAQYEVVIWLSTTGDVLNTEQQASFERYIANGGGYAGVHAASDTEYDWSWYGGLVGAYFSGHPQNQDATIKVEDGVHPSTAHLPSRWDRYDEWYNFRTSPRDTVHVLASLDETSYDAGSAKMGSDHPIAWCQDLRGRPLLVHRRRAHPGQLHRAGIRRAPAGRHPDRRGRRRLRLQRDAERELRACRARRGHAQPDDARRRTGRHGLLRRA